MTDSYNEEQVANHGEEIVAREYERQREEGVEERSNTVEDYSDALWSDVPY